MPKLQSIEIIVNVLRRYTIPTKLGDGVFLEGGID